MGTMLSDVLCSIRTETQSIPNSQRPTNSQNPNSQALGMQNVIAGFLNGFTQLKSLGGWVLGIDWELGIGCWELTSAATVAYMT